VTNQERSDFLRRTLFEQPEDNLYAVLDGAAVKHLRSLIAEHDLEHVCLLRGELVPELAEVAPYLVRLPQESGFTELVVSKGWGNNWGIFVVSPHDMRAMRMHLRQFLDVWDPNGKPLYFRFYDPRVLRVFLPTCDGVQLPRLFRGVSTFFAEGEGMDALLRFEFSGSQLSRQEIRLPATQTS
jgi:hypothetical protein